MRDLEAHGLLQERLGALEEAAQLPSLGVAIGDAETSVTDKAASLPLPLPLPRCASGCWSC